MYVTFNKIIHNVCSLVYTHKYRLYTVYEVYMRIYKPEETI